MEDYLNKYDWVAPFNQGVAIVVKDNKYGAILTGGQEIIAPSYDYISSFNEGFAQAIKNGQCVIVDLSGSECKRCGNKIIRVPKEYDVVRDFKDGLACVQKNGKWGVIDTDCKEIFPPKFFYISDFVSGTAKYKLYDNKQWGYLNSEGFCSDCNMEKEPEIETDGTLMIERYEKPNEINTNKRRRTIKIDNNGNLIVKNGNNDVIVSKDYHIARDFFCGVACVQNTDGCWGAINERGEVILPFDYFSIQDFECERSFACDKKRRLRLISSTGSVFEEFDYSWYSYKCRPFEGDYSIIKKEDQSSYYRKDEKYGVIDKSGQEIIKIAYDRIKDIKKDRVVAEIKDIGEFCFGLDGKSCIIENQIISIPDWCLGVQHINGDIFSALSDRKKWGIINTNGEILCEPVFDKIGDVRDDIVVGESYSNGTKYGLFALASNVSIPAIYDSIPEIEGNYYKVKKNDLYGFIDINGTELLKPEYKEITKDLGYGYYIVRKDHKQGLLNAHFETIFEPQYEEITIIRKGLYRICKSYSRPKKWTLFNDSGQISNSFDEMGSSINKGLIRVSKYGKKGFINIDGSIVIHSDDNKPIELPTKFSWGEDFVNGIAAVWINGFPNYVDKNFNVIINNNGNVVKISTKLDYIISVNRDQNYTFVYQRKVGLLSKDGKLLVDPKYNFLSFYNDGLYLATIKDENKKSCGIISTNGELIVPITYASITPFLGKAKKEEHLVWDQDEWIDISDELSDGAPKINEEDIKYWLTATDDDKYGLINADAEVCLEAKYSDIVQVGKAFLVENEIQKSILDDHFKLKLPLADTYTKLESYDGRVHHKENWEEKEKTDHTIPEPVIPEESVKLGLLYNNYGYGLIDDKGNLCIDTKYDNIVQSEHVFFVKWGKLWGVVNDRFETVIEPKYDSAKAFKYGFLTENYRANDNNVGLIDKYGNEVLEPIYHRIWSSDSEGIIYFCKKENNGKLMYGVMNEKFDIIVQPEFSYISDFQNGRAYANNQINEPSRLEPVYQCGYLNTEGKFSDFLDLIDVKNGYYPDRIKVIDATGEGLTIIQIIDSNPNNQYCAIINSEGKVILPFMYHSIKASNGGTYKVMIRKKNINSFSDTEKWYLLDEKFDLLFSEACSSISEINNRFIVSLAINKVGLIDHNGNALLPCEYSSIEDAGNGLLLIEKRWETSSDYGLSTFDGKVLLDCKYGRIPSFVDDRAIVVYHGSYNHPGGFGVIDIHGKEIIAPVCKEITYKKRYKQFLVTREFPIDLFKKEIKSGRFSIDGCQIIKDAKGKDIIAPKKYDWYDDFDENSHAVVYRNGEKGFVNSKFQMVFHLNSNDEDRVINLPEEYDWGYFKSNDYFIVEKNEKKGVLKTDNTLIIDCLYDEIRLINHNSECLFLCGNLKIKSSIASYYRDHDYTWTLVNKDGKSIADHYDVIRLLQGDNCSLMLCGKLNVDHSFNSYVPDCDFLWTVLDTDGKHLFIPSKLYTDLVVMGNNLIALKQKNGKYSIYKYTGKLVTNKQYDVVLRFAASAYAYSGHHSDCSSDNDGALYAIVGEAGKFGAINRFGEEIIPIGFESLSIKGHNQIVADGVLMNISGQTIVANDNITLPLSRKYDDAHICENGLIVVKNGDFCGCLTQTGEIVVPIIYSKIECYDRFIVVSQLDDEFGYYDNYYRNDNDGCIYKTGVINYLNEVIIPLKKEYQDFVICEKYIKCRETYPWITKWVAFSLQGEKVCEPKYDQIEYFANNLYKVGMNRYSAEKYDSDGSFIYEYEKPGNSGIDWGIIDSKGNIVLPLEYDEIGNRIEDGRIMVRNRLQKGFIDIMGNVLLKPSYYTINAFVDGFAIVSKKYVNKQTYEEYYRYGVIDCSYSEVIPCVFKSIKYEKRLGLFNTDKGYKTVHGKNVIKLNEETILISEKYAFCLPFNNGSAIAIKYVNGRTYSGLISSKAEDILPPLFQSLRHMGYGLYRYKLNDKYGVVDNKGNIVLPNLYMSIGMFDEELAIIIIKNDMTNKGELGAKLYGYFNAEGKIVLPAEFDFIGKRSEGCSVIRREKDGAWGVFNRTTQEFKIIDNAAHIGSCKNGLCIVNVGGYFDRVKKKTDGGKWGYILADGKEALPPVDYLGIRSDNYSVIRNDKTWGLFNLTTYEVIMIKCASYLGPYKDGLCLINVGGVYDPKKKKADGGKWGFINIEGAPVLPIEYDFVGKRNENFSVIRNDLNWGLFNLVTHEVKIFENASYIGPCNNGLCRINVGGIYDIETNKISGGKWGYLAPDKGIVMEPNFSMAISFQQGMAAVKIDDKWGFINTNGDMIVPCEYDELISSYTDGKGKLCRNDYIEVFDKEGKNISSQRRRYYGDDDGYDDYNDDYVGFDDYDTPTYDKYGGPGGYSDQTIDEAFDGDPSQIYNIE